MSFNLSDFRQAFLKVAVILALAMLGGPGLNAAVVLLIAWCLLGPRQTIESLTMLGFLTSLNAGVFPSAEINSSLRFAALPIAMGINLLRYRYRRDGIPSPMAWLLLFAVAVAALSVKASHFPEGSLVRLALFLVGAITALLCAQMTIRNIAAVRKWFLYGLGSFILLGFPLIALSDGYNRNGFSFQGLTGQPQAYAVILACYAAWLLMLIYNGSLKGKIWLGLLAISLVSLLMTNARAGILALIIATVVSGLVHLTSNKQLVGKYTGRIIILAMSAALALSLVYAVIPEEINNIVWGFISKKTQAGGIGEAFQMSRGVLAGRSWNNFLQSPIAGIGFALPSRVTDLDIVWLGMIPVVSSVEKGILFAAVLEEIGLIGASFFLCLVLSLLLPAIRAKNAPAVAIGTAAFATNFGESTFFYMGGIGLMIWLFIAYAVAEARVSAALRQTMVKSSGAKARRSNPREKVILSGPASGRSDQ